MTGPSTITSSRQSRSGFTLLEVLMALAILGGGMFILLQSHFASMSLFSDTQDAALIELLTQQGTTLAEVEILSGQESGDGDFGEEFPDYSYTYQTEFVDDIETPGLMQVEFRLTGPHDEHEIRFRVYDGILVEEGDGANAE